MSLIVLWICWSAFLHFKVNTWSGSTSSRSLIPKSNLHSSGYQPETLLVAIHSNGHGTTKSLRVHRPSATASYREAITSQSGVYLKTTAPSRTLVYGWLRDRSVSVRRKSNLHPWIFYSSDDESSCGDTDTNVDSSHGDIVAWRHKLLGSAFTPFPHLVLTEEFRRCAI